MPSTRASLSLRGVDFGEFGGARTEYAGVPADGVTETTVEAEAAQGRASVSIEPPDTDQSAAGHQVALGDVPEITVTVTSPDGSRERVYRVLLGQEEAAGPARRKRPRPPRSACAAPSPRASASSSTRATASRTSWPAWRAATSPLIRMVHCDTNLRDVTLLH